MERLAKKYKIIENIGYVGGVYKCTLKNGMVLKGATLSWLDKKIKEIIKEEN